MGAWTVRKRSLAHLEVRTVETDTARKRDPVRKRYPNQTTSMQRRASKVVRWLKRFPGCSVQRPDLASCA